MALGYIYPISLRYDTRSFVGRPMPNGRYAGRNGGHYDANEFVTGLQNYLCHVQNQQIKNQGTWLGGFWDYTCSYPEKAGYLQTLITAIQNGENAQQILDLIREGINRFCCDEIYMSGNRTLSNLLLEYGARLEQAINGAYIELQAR